MLLLLVDIGTRNQMAVDTDLIALSTILFDQIGGCFLKHDRYKVRLRLTLIRFPETLHRQCVVANLPFPIHLLHLDGPHQTPDQ